MPVVHEIWRYPAKSMLGEALRSIVISPSGAIGDRGWAVRDEVRGGIRGAKKIPRLMRLSARYVSEPTGSLPPPHIEIGLPDGGVVRSDEPDVNARLSKALDHEVTLWPLQPADDADHYRRGAPDSDDPLVEMRGMFGLAEDEPFPDISKLPLDVLVQFESPPGTYFDAYPLHLLTTSSLLSLARLTPDSCIDVRRFRPNLVIDTDDDPDDPFPEQGWVGSDVEIGALTLRVVSACPRCVMTTHALADLPTDRDVLRSVKRHAHQDFGVYATVVTPGTISVGDEVRLVSDDAPGVNGR